ncbi:alpha/beta-hydrolase [Tothia fuscella]|uniref:Alpha/beta-hydrolase n=1 Tax=Tothia fuscella TaxID=1048955 RepID=A0A9P4NL87_9PEZI|nr:alpha/beta-hydrolase [Tothia fuscella]
MASLLLLAAAIIFRKASASPIDSFSRAHGDCTQFNIPVVATAPSAIYDIPRVNNDIEAAAWTIHSGTWSIPEGPQLIIRNTTTFGTFNIHVQLCVPKSTSKNTLQIATHGVHYDSRYWDPELVREKQSYVEASLKAGYTILTYDRLGTGQSDIPNAYDVVQAPLELEILRQLTLLARNGTLYNLASKVNSSSAAFHSLPKPNKVTHIGHSFGSFITSAFIARYPDLTEGAIITGFILSKYLGMVGTTAFSPLFGGVSPYNRPSGYIVCSKTGIQNIFFGGNLTTAYSTAMLDYGNAIKQPFAVGELASAFNIIGLPGPGLKAPVQYVLAEFDFYICAGDCKGLADPKVLAATYPNAKEIEVVIQPNTGHAFTLHNNATAGYQLTFDFLAKHGL